MSLRFIFIYVFVSSLYKSSFHLHMSLRFIFIFFSISSSYDLNINLHMNLQMSFNCSSQFKIQTSLADLSAINLLVVSLTKDSSTRYSIANLLHRIAICQSSRQSSRSSCAHLQLNIQSLIYSWIFNRSLTVEYSIAYLQLNIQPLTSSSYHLHIHDPLQVSYSTYNKWVIRLIADQLPDL